MLFITSSFSCFFPAPTSVAMMHITFGSHAMHTASKKTFLYSVLVLHAVVCVCAHVRVIFLSIHAILPAITHLLQFQRRKNIFKKTRVRYYRLFKTSSCGVAQNEDLQKLPALTSSRASALLLLLQLHHGIYLLPEKKRVRRDENLMKNPRGFMGLCRTAAVVPAVPGPEGRTILKRMTDFN